MSQANKNLEQLDTYRKQIDDIDKKIVDLLNARTKTALSIRDVKIKYNLPFYHPDREKVILSNLKNYNTGPFPSNNLLSIFKEVILASREVQSNVSVAYLGPKGSYTHLACLREFGNFTETHSMTTIPDVFSYVENNHAEYGIVPVENSYEGMVNRTLDSLIDTNLNIIAEIYLPIVHCLLSQLDDISQIKKVYSHTQSFAQCRLWLNSKLPGVEKIETTSNSKAAEIVEWDKYSAAIAGEAAADIYGLGILAKNIQTASTNTTRFLVIAKESYKVDGSNGERIITVSDNLTEVDYKTSIICTVKDKPGALMRILAPFQEANLNLTKIESRPSRKKAWEYLFFIDIEAHSSNLVFKDAINKIRHICYDVKTLGSYPKGLNSN